MNSASGHSWANSYALVDYVEDRIAHDDVLFARPARARQLESASVELFVNHDRSGAIPGQNLHRVPTLADEHEQSPRSRLRLHSLSHDRTQSLAAKAHVHWVERHVDGQPVSDHASPSRNAATTARNNSSSNPRLTRISAQPTRTEIASSFCAAETKRAKRGLGPFATFLAPSLARLTHRYAVDAPTPSRAAASDTVVPPLLTADSSLFRCSPVYRFRIHPP
jgi:hypothetical protein